MLQQLKQLVTNDDLILHKIGLVIGTLLGVLLGLVISDQADQYIIEEVDTNDSQED